MRIPKAVRDRYFQIGVQHRIAVLEAELATLRSYVGRKQEPLSGHTEAVARKNAKRKSQAVSSKMQRWWKEHKRGKVITHKVKRSSLSGEQRQQRSERLSAQMKRIWAERTPEARVRHAKLMARARNQSA